MCYLLNHSSFDDRENIFTPYNHYNQIGNIYNLGLDHETMAHASVLLSSHETDSVLRAICEGNTALIDGFT